MPHWFQTIAKEIKSNFFKKKKKKKRRKEKKKDPYTPPVDNFRNKFCYEGPSLPQSNKKKKKKKQSKTKPTKPLCSFSPGDVCRCGKAVCTNTGTLGNARRKEVEGECTKSMLWMVL